MNINYNLKSKYKKAMVTGGAGFIGSHLVESLLKEGLKVISIDDYSTGKFENLKHLEGNPNLEIINCDITDYDKFKNHFKGVDIIFHQAASKKTICLSNPRRDLQVNGGGAFNVLELSRDFKVKKIVHASTGSVYGEPTIFPQDENHPLQPNSYYGVSKLCGERYARAFVDLYDLDVTILRYFHVYGPRQEYNDFGGVISIFCRKLLKNQSPIIYGDGSQQRSFTYVEDVVNINKLVSMKSETKGEVYNIPSGKIKTVLNVAEDIRKNLKKEDIEIVFDDWAIGDVKFFNLDNNKIKKLGYKNFVSYKTGLKNTIEWMKTVDLQNDKK